MILAFRTGPDIRFGDNGIFTFQYSEYSLTMLRSHQKPVKKPGSFAIFSETVENS